MCADGENLSKDLEQRVSLLERKCQSQEESNVSLQLQLEDLQGHNRRNNIHIQGILEVMGQEDLQDMVKCIIQKILKDAMPLNCELDRVHRALALRLKIVIVPVILFEVYTTLRIERQFCVRPGMRGQ